MCVCVCVRKRKARSLLGGFDLGVGCGTRKRDEGLAVFDGWGQKREGEQMLDVEIFIFILWEGGGERVVLLWEEGCWCGLERVCEQIARRAAERWRGGDFVEVEMGWVTDNRQGVFFCVCMVEGQGQSY